MKTKLALLLIGALFAQPLAAQRSAAPQEVPTPRTVVIEDAAQQFASNDRDGDGYVTLAEWLSTDAEGDADAGRGVFAKIDVNRDSRLTKQELTNWQYALFDCMDTNRDGQLWNAEAEPNAMRCIVDVGGFPKPKLK